MPAAHAPQLLDSTKIVTSMSAIPGQPAFSALAAIFESGPDAIISTDGNLHITAWNPAAERMLGFTTAEAVGRPISIIAPPGQEPSQLDAMRRALAGDHADTVETVRRTRSGSLIDVTMTLLPIRDAAGGVAGVTAVVRELSDQQRAERALRRLASIVESSDDAIISKDLDGIVTSWNRAAERIFGWAAAEMIGRSIRTIIPADRQREEDDVLLRIRRGEKIDHFETVRQRRDGSLVEISLTVSPLRDAGGVVVGASKIARDIGDRREIETERTSLFARLEEQSRITATLNDVGRVVSSTLDRKGVVQGVTDAATAVTGAEFGAFFYNVMDPKSGASYRLYALSGAPLEAFASFPQPRATPIFAPTFHGEGIVRLDDVTADPRYGHNPPHRGLPAGHLPVRSYLAAPVKGRTGEVIGGLFFGHSAPGRFSAVHERLLEGIASWAAVALENAALYVTAQEANRLKDEFLATLSHELRTPLNSILGYSRMVRGGLVTGDKQPRALETIERNATALTRIVEDVLDISRIVSGKLRLRVQQVDLRVIVTAAVDAVLPAADAKGVRIERVLEAPDVPVSGDPDRLQQVVWNLLSNAVKYTPRGGKVQVNLLRVNSHVEVVVSDTGMGIAAEFLPYVFERFRQAEAGINRARGGLGLGLAIAKDLVELHGGTIEAASAGENRGATVRVKLPVMIVKTAGDMGARVHPQAGAAMPAFPIPDLTGVRVLAVDDEEESQRLVREVLEVAGATVDTAGSGPEALECLADTPADVLIADLGMPGMDGLRLIGEIRRHPDLQVRRVAAAALTAYARSEDRTQALQSGFQLHLAKPIEPSELLAAVAALARRPGSV
jgi:PAS domain S-box-containing protein